MKLYSSFPNEENLDFWIKNRLNVLFRGRHGVGKTSIILESFIRNNLKFKQFSAATMDPWVDFIGIPKEQKDERGSYIELIRPKDLRDDNVEAIFFDEFNRSHPKVRNAVMELIQSKSINGKKFPNLKIIWAAVNPDEDEDLKFDVQKLDPAQEDRFHIHLEIPYEPYSPYFTKKFGKQKSLAAIEWWNSLPDNIKLEVSPRRLEYALDIHEIGGNLLYVLPPHSNVSKLISILKNGSPLAKYRSLIKLEDKSELIRWISDENNYSFVKDEITKHPENIIEFLPEEKIVSLISESTKTENFIFNNYNKFSEIIKNLAKNSNNNNIKRKAISTVQSNTGQANLDILNINKSKIPATILSNVATVSTAYTWNKNPNIIYNKFTKSYFQLENSISSCFNAASCSTQTQDKVRICVSIVKIIASKSPTSITKDEAESCLSIIEWFSSKVQESTINKIENIKVVINICVSVLRNFKVINDVKDFAVKYPFITGKIICNIGNKTNYDLCIIPQK